MAAIPYSGQTDALANIPMGNVFSETYEKSANKGQPGGYAPLDQNLKVPAANLPDQAALDAEVAAAVSAHNALTTSVHGIANTANLVLTDDARLSNSRTPTAHTHAISDVTNLQATLDGKSPSSHSHPIAGVVGLQTALDGKQASGSYSLASHTHSDATTSVAGFLSIADKTKLDSVASGAEVNVNADWNSSSGDSQILNKPASFAPSAHKTSHATGGTDAITPADIGAQPAGNYEVTTNKNTANGYAGLGEDGKIPLNLLPDLNALESEAIAFAIALG